MSFLCYRSWSQDIWGIIPTNTSMLTATSKSQALKTETERMKCFFAASCVTICLYSDVYCVTTRGDRGNQLQIFIFFCVCALDESWWRDRERGQSGKKKEEEDCDIWSWEAAAFLQSLLVTNTHSYTQCMLAQTHSYTHKHSEPHAYSYTHMPAHIYIPT